MRCAAIKAAPEIVDMPFACGDMPFVSTSVQVSADLQLET